MLKKIFKFLIGYVIIEISGCEKERFINICLHNKIKIGEVVPCKNGLRAAVSKRDFCRLRRPAKKCGVTVRIKSKHGMGIFMKRYGKRYGFAVAAAAVGIFLIAAPQYIWCVELEEAYDVDTEAVMEILKRHGVYVGAKKSGISELAQIKADIVSETDGINWAWLYIEGTKARLSVQKSLPVPKLADTDTPTDIGAAYDGLIRSVNVMRGERLVDTGMNVSKGQILVSGKVPVFREGEPEKYSYVHSRAEIIADTVRSETGFFTDTETLRIRTGNRKQRAAVTLFGKEIRLFKNIDCGFEEYDVETARSNLAGYEGISAAVYTVYEVKTAENKLNEQEILERAKERLEERICKKLLPGAVKTAEELTYSIENGVYRVQLRIHFRENIGMEIPMEE